MAVSKERFEQGLTYDGYRAQMTRNREKLEENERTVALAPADIDAFRAAGPLHVLVLTEDWCGDALANVPTLGRIAREAGTLDLRVFLRDANEDLAGQYLNGEYRSIPVFAFFDEAFREIGRWIERPASVTALRKERRATIYASDPRFGSPDAPADQLADDVRADLTAALQQMRDEMRPFADSEVVRELKEIVARVA